MIEDIAVKVKITHLASTAMTTATCRWPDHHAQHTKNVLAAGLCCGSQRVARSTGQISTAVSIARGLALSATCLWLMLQQPRLVAYKPSLSSLLHLKHDCLVKDLYLELEGALPEKRMQGGRRGDQ